MPVMMVAIRRVAYLRQAALAATSKIVWMQRSSDSSRLDSNLFSPAVPGLPAESDTYYIANRGWSSGEVEFIDKQQMPLYCASNLNQ